MEGVTCARMECADELVLMSAHLPLVGLDVANV